MKRMPSAAGRAHLLRHAAIAEHAEMAHEGIERPPVTGRTDHRFRLDLHPIGEPTPPSRMIATAATTSIRPSLIASLTSESTIAGTLPRVRTSVKTHARAEAARIRSGRRSPCASRSARSGRPGAVGRCQSQVRDQVPWDRPGSLSKRMFGGVRTASQTFAAPSSASSLAISIPELRGPPPARAARRMDLGSGTQMSGSAALEVSRPGQLRDERVLLMARATITCDARSSPALV